MSSTEPHVAEPMAAPTPWRKTVGIGVILAAAVTVILLAFSWPAVTSEVKDLPVAVAGNSAQVDAVTGALGQRSPGTFDFTSAADRDAATDLIETREVYGALVLGQKPEMLVSSAASPIVSQALTAVAGQLGAQLTQAAQAQGAQVPGPIVVTVTDVVPLASTDARGAGLTASSFPLIIGGILGGVLVSVLVVGAWRRITTILVYSAIGGVVLAAIMQGWFGVLQGGYAVNSAAMALALLAIGAPTIGLNALFGRAGIALGPIVMLLIANPMSGAAQPLEFLPTPWGAVGQWFPPGAAATLLRDLSYFPDANASFPWLVLACWAAGGLVLAAVGHFRSGATVSAPHEQLAVNEGSREEHALV
jgi:hypothetical protein